MQSIVLTESMIRVGECMHTCNMHMHMHMSECMRMHMHMRMHM